MTEELIVTPHQDLLDRVALVTGAASGIGLAITKRRPPGRCKGRIMGFQ